MFRRACIILFRIGEGKLLEAISINLSLKRIFGRRIGLGILTSAQSSSFKQGDSSRGVSVPRHERVSSRLERPLGGHFPGYQFGSEIF
jgi:hypothetical protein